MCTIFGGYKLFWGPTRPLHLIVWSPPRHVLRLRSVRKHIRPLQHILSEEPLQIILDKPPAGGNVLVQLTSRPSRLQPIAQCFPEGLCQVSRLDPLSLCEA